MEKVVLKRSGKPGLEFEGELLYEGETSPDQASDRWSGAVGRWKEVRGYHTRGGEVRGVDRPLHPVAGGAGYLYRRGFRLPRGGDAVLGR